MERRSNYIERKTDYIERTAQSNLVSVRGKIGKPPVRQYGNGKVNYYSTVVEVKRGNDHVDKIPVLFSDRTIDVAACYIGKIVEIRGQFHSYNQRTGSEHHLRLYVQARTMFFPVERKTLPRNQILLDGYICRPPQYRKTPLNKEITDLLLAVNRFHAEADYIPCICWQKEARLAYSLEVGSHILIRGRIQSREYTKKLENEATETRTAYEVSVMNLKSIEPVPENENGIAFLKKLM
ncbi:MAG: single-stranded DNA-binding protein [Clostridiales bacterium]|nr:single-stranded DNA-binding protein [Candidatus Blautia equi]